MHRILLCRSFILKAMIKLYEDMFSFLFSVCEAVFDILAVMPNFWWISLRSGGSVDVI